jgi:hypothetical protein
MYIHINMFTYTYTYTYAYMYACCMHACIYLSIQNHPFISNVRAEVNRTLAQLAAWSIGIATSGIAPTAGFKGEPFAKDSDRAKRAGAKLANGWKSHVIYILIYFPLEVVFYMFMVSCCTLVALLLAQTPMCMR